MASHNYGPTMYPSDITITQHVGALSAANASHYLTVPGTGSHQYTSKHEPVAHKPLDAPYNSSVTEPPSKKRRIDDGSIALKFLPQKKWQFSDSQPWIEVQNPTTSRAKTGSKTIPVGNATTLSQQLPTPQTPHFPPNAASHPTSLSRRFPTDPMALSQPAHEPLKLSTLTALQYSVARQQDTTQESMTSSRVDPHIQQQFGPLAPPRQTSLSEQQRRNSTNLGNVRGGAKDSSQNSDFVSGLTVDYTAAVQAESKSKVPIQTLSLEKDADQIAALIATKRKENEANLFRVRLLQKQIEHQNQKNPRSSGAVSGSSGIAPLQLVAGSNITMQTNAPDASRGGPYSGVQRNSELTSSSHYHRDPRPPTPNRSPSYAAQAFAHMAQSTRQEPAVLKHRQDIRKTGGSSVTSSNLSGSPSPRTTILYTHDSELDRPEYPGNRRSSNTTHDPFQAPSAAELRSSRAISKPQDTPRRGSTQRPVASVPAPIDLVAPGLQQGVNLFKASQPNQWDGSKSATSFASSTSMRAGSVPTAAHSTSFDSFPSSTQRATNITDSFQPPQHHTSPDLRMYQQQSHLRHDMSQSFMAPPSQPTISDTSYYNLQEPYFYAPNASQKGTSQRPTSSRLNELAQQSLSDTSVASTAQQIQPRAQTSTSMLNSSLGLREAHRSYNDYQRAMRERGIY